MESERKQITVRLAAPVRAGLRFVAAERNRLPAELARELIETGLERALADPELRRRYMLWNAGGEDTALAYDDVVAALTVPGVPSVLAGHWVGAGPEARRAASFLVRLSSWLADAAPVSAKGPRPLLGEQSAQVPGPGDVGAALALAQDGDGEAVRRAAQSRRSRASDKAKLSDSAPQRGGEVRNEWT